MADPAHTTSCRPGLLLRLYRGLAPAVCGATALAAPFSAKLRRGLAGRDGLLDRVHAAADRLQGCVWVHVASVGEYEQARPIITALRRRTGADALPVAVTHFSPSGFDFAQRHPSGDFHDYSPLDHPDTMHRLVAAWQPRLLLFVKWDCWPNQVLAARRHGVPVVLLAGSLPPRSARLGGPARRFFRNLFDCFSLVGAAREADRRRFVHELGVSCPVQVTGDTRAQQVIRRYESAADGEVAWRLRVVGGRWLVLGSTWPPDEALWLPALPELLARFPDLRVVLVPHEPLPRRLQQIEAALEQRGITSRRLSALMADEAVVAPSGTPATYRCVLVDSVGVLAEIYRVGTLAYVGGSFTTGVHSTLEPAVAGLPVMFGPRISNAEEAGVLVERGAGFVLRKSHEAVTCAGDLLDDPTRLAAAGGIARRIVDDQRGAVQRSLLAIEKFL